MGPLEEDYIETVLTCEGDFYDPQFHTQLQDFSNRLQDLIATEEKQKLIIKKVEPWNSVRVTFNIPKEAAIRLKHLAEQGDSTLRQLGVLAVQIEGDRVISLTIAGKNNETTELVFHTTATAPVGSVNATGPTSMFDVSSSDEPGPANVETTRKNIAQYLRQQGDVGGIFDSILNQGTNVEKSHNDPLSLQRQQSQFPFGSPNRSPSSTLGVQVPFSAGRSPTGFPSPSASQSFPSPGSGRSQMSPGSPKFPTPPPQVHNPHSPGSRQGQQVNFQLPFPHGNPNVNNLQRLMAAGGKDITSSSPLLVNLLQSDVATGHFNNLPHQHRLPFPFEGTGHSVKRKRRPRKNKDGSPKVPKLGDSEEASIPLPGTFPVPNHQQQHMENRVPPMGMEAALYNVPHTLANVTAGNEAVTSVTPAGGAQVHTPPLAETSQGNLGGPSSNQVSPNSSGTLSVSSPSPIRTTPERSMGSSGMQQIINPYTGQLEPVENSPSDKTTKSEGTGDNTALDVPVQLQPPPNPLVALENRLAARSQNLSLPSQLQSSPRTVDSPVNSLPNPVQVSTAAGTIASSPSKAPLPPISSSSSDSMQSNSLPVSIPSLPPSVRPGNSLASAAGTVHPASDSQHLFNMSAPRGITPTSSSTVASSVAQSQGPTDVQGIHRHPHVPLQHNHPAHRLPIMAQKVPGNADIISPDLRPPVSGMGHPDLRLRMPQRHPAGMPHLMATDHHGLPHYSNIQRPQAQGMPAGPSLSMHAADTVANSGRSLTRHPAMSHPRHNQPMPPGYYQHVQQQRLRMPVTNTASAAHVMTSNPPPMLSQAPPASSNSVIASQLMRPTLATASTIGMPTSSVGSTVASSTGSAQITHPAIASQLSQSNSSPTKLPLPKIDSKVPTSGSCPVGPDMDNMTGEKSTNEIVQQTRTIPSNEMDNSKDTTTEDKPMSPQIREDSKEPVSEPVQDMTTACEENSNSSDNSSGSKAASNVVLSNSDTSKPLPSLSEGNEMAVFTDKGISDDKPVQVSSQVTNSTNAVVNVSSTDVMDHNSEQPGAVGSGEVMSSQTIDKEEKKDEAHVEIVSNVEQGKEKESDISDKKADELAECQNSHDEQVKSDVSPLLESETSVPSGSQASDSPPTTSSPGDSEGTPILDNFDETKLNDVRIQPSPPRVRTTTLSAIAMHNDLHSLVRGSNGASTGEASPVSDNLSSTSQQNYGQSPLGNNVGLHMNHDSELSSHSFDENSSTPPHPQVVTSSLGTTIVRENHKDGATKSKDDSNPPTKESLPKDQPAASVPETKNILTVGYAVAKEPILRKEIADGLLNPSSKSLEDIPYLKKPSVGLSENSVSSKGIPFTGIDTEKIPEQAQTDDSDKKENLVKNISKNSLNYRGQVPLFSRTMETCDINPGGKQECSSHIPVNGDVSDVQSDTANSAIIPDLVKRASSDESSHPRQESSPSDSNLEDTDVPGKSVETTCSVLSDDDKSGSPVNKVEAPVDSQQPTESDITATDSLENSQVESSDETVCDSCPTEPSRSHQDTHSLTSGIVEKTDDGDGMETEKGSSADDREVKTKIEEYQQPTASTDEESRIKPEAAPCQSAGPTTAASAAALVSPPIERKIQPQSVMPNTSTGVLKSSVNTTRAAREIVTTSAQPTVDQNDATKSNTGLLAHSGSRAETKSSSGLSELKISIDEAHRLNSLNPSKVGGGHAVGLLKTVTDLVNTKSGCDTTDITENIQAKNSMSTPEKTVPVKVSGLHESVLAFKKSSDEHRQTNILRSTESTKTVGITIATTQLQTLTKSVESKLTVAVVSNSPPGGISTTGMNKSISPVIKAVSSSKPVEVVTSVNVSSTVTSTTNTSLPSIGSALYSGSVSSPIVSSAVRTASSPVCSSGIGIVSAPFSLPISSNTNIVGQARRIPTPSKSDGSKVSVEPASSSPSSTAVTTVVRTQVLGIPSVLSTSSPRKPVVVTNVQAKTVSSIPVQSKVCIVSTVGNTKVAIHTLNSVAESGQTHNISSVIKGLSKQGVLQACSAGMNAQSDSVAKVSPTTSIMIKDITRKVDSHQSVNVGASIPSTESNLTKMEMVQSSARNATVYNDSAGLSRHFTPTKFTGLKQTESVSTDANRISHSTQQPGRLTSVSTSVPNTIHSSQKTVSSKELLHTNIDSAVSVTKSVNQNIGIEITAASFSKHKNTPIVCSAHTSLQNKMTVKQSGTPGTEVRTSQLQLTHGGRIGSGHLVPTGISSQLSATSNLESGTATAAIQAVAAHVKAAHGPSSIHTPQEQQKRISQSSKGISILKPLYDRELDLDDNEMDPNLNVASSPPKVSQSSTKGAPRKTEDKNESHLKTTPESTAYSIAQILDHAKRAMAEEKQQKESKASTVKEKAKVVPGKGVKQSKPMKSNPTSKVQPSTAAVASSVVTPDFPLSSSVQLTNFVQKSKQTPAMINSINSPHPIMAPEFHLNLTESVQKVMQAIPSDALSPPPCPPKVVRPGSVFTKFGDKKEIEEEVAQPGSTVATTAVVNASHTSPLKTLPVSATVIVTSATSAPVTSHKSTPNVLNPSVSPISSLSPSARTVTVISPRKTPTPPAATSIQSVNTSAVPVVTTMSAIRKTPTPPAALTPPAVAVTAVRRTPTPPAALAYSTQQVTIKNLPVSSAAVVGHTPVRKVPTPPAAVSPGHTNVKIVSSHSAGSRNTPTPPFSRNTPTPPGGSTVIHSRSPHSTPPAKDMSNVKSGGVKFEIMPQPHGASTIVVIKSDNKDPTPPPISDGTQTIVLGHKDLIKKSIVSSSGKYDNIAVVTTTKSENIRKITPTIIGSSSATVASSAPIIVPHIRPPKQTLAATVPSRVQPAQWRRADMAQGPIRISTPSTPQISNIVSVMKNVSMHSRIVQSKPVAAITVVSPAKQMVVGTAVPTVTTSSLSSPVTISSRTVYSESSAVSRPTTVSPAGQSLKLLVATAKPVTQEEKPIVQETKSATVESNVDKKLIEATTSQISPTIEPTLVKRSRKRSAEREVQVEKIEQDQPNNNNKNEKRARKSSDSSHGSEEPSRPARISRRRSRESTESQQSTANSESGRTRSSRRRGASESSDVSVNSDGHSSELRSTPSTRSSVDRSESPPRATRASTRSSTRKRTSAEREDTASHAVVKNAVTDKERSVSPAPSKGTRGSKRKLVLEEVAPEDQDSRKTRQDSGESGQAETKGSTTEQVETNVGNSESTATESRSKRPSTKQDTTKTVPPNSAKQSAVAPASKRPVGRSSKTDNAEPADDHTYSGSRRTNTRSSGNPKSQEVKEEVTNKKAQPAAKKDEKVVTGRYKGKQTVAPVTEDAIVAATEETDVGAKRPTRSTRNKDRTELPPPIKRRRSSRDH